MAGRKATAIRPSGHPAMPEVKDADTQRALDALARAVDALATRRDRDLVTFDLVVGTNKVPHGLGRACTSYSVTPTVADATFAHAIDTDNPRPDREVWITVVGVAQPGARIEVV